MIGLMVIRGHGLQPGREPCATDARARFQRAYVTEWLATKDQTAEHWLALGQGYGRPVSPMHPVLQRGLLESVDRKVPLVIDNALRLFDYADAAGALSLFRFFRKSRFPIVSALHNARLHDIDEGVFTAMLADRFHHERERQALVQIRREAKGVSNSKQPSDTLQVLSSDLPAAEVASRYFQLNAYRLCLALEEEGVAPPYSVDQLATGLNEHGMLTSGSKPWTAASLRRVLNGLRAEAPDSGLLAMIRRSGSRFA